AAGQANAPLFINGLYDVRLELVPHVEWGSLNETALPLSLRFPGFNGQDGTLSLVENMPAQRAQWAGVARAHEAAADLMAALTLSLGDVGPNRVRVECLFAGNALPALQLRLDSKTASYSEAEWLALL